ncbi:MAG: PAS domain S-box protein [Desulfarculaceae bacterium]|nr:PAS domain S-box protein [Desulfarculaceae bacterium]MCF8049472.1 PAS domain S-box protein [Desulfarculaceae bacterium]MCF8064144.1 PAS domain S-box protein [Desulfarculaceae bacterium]MCF8097140.1 PAS domain S-box protein [Desulfarculaceae bacterium]
MSGHSKSVDVRQWQQTIAELSRENQRLRQEVTELQETQGNILHAKLEWERTFDAVPDLIAIIDRDYRIRRVNRAFTQRLNLEFRDILGQPCYQLICDSDAPPSYCPYVKCLASDGKKVSGIEANVLGGDFSLSFAPTCDQQGRINGGVHILHDIKERKEHERNIRETRERFRQIINSMPVMLNAHDAQGNLVFWNNECERVTGYSANEMVRNPDAMKLLYPEPQGNRYVNNLLKETKRKFRIVQEELTSKDGAKKTVSWSNISEQFPIQDWAEWAVGLDVTEQKQAEEEAKRLEKRLQISQKMESLGTLASGIAHDFNNYLSVIMGCLQLAINGTPPDHDCLAYLKLSLKAANNAKDLTRQILSFGRQSQADKSPVYLGAIMKEALKLLRASLPTSINISTHIPDEPGFVLGNPSQIQQVIINLGANAVHALRDHGDCLSISLSRVEIGEDDHGDLMDLPPGPYHLITFTDNGEGMKSEVMERIFEPFFTTKKVGEGTGMGLAVVHGIVKSCGGEISVSSKLGQGTTFRIYFPLIQVLSLSSTAPTGT